LKLVIQRVSRAEVEVAGMEPVRIGPGLLVLLGVAEGDTTATAGWLALKTVSLRIFDDGEGKMNLDLAEMKGEILVISQFTLYGDCRKGRRPGFDRAAPSARAEKLYQEYCLGLEKLGFPPRTGVFGERMKVSCCNDGPVTLILEKE